MADINHITVLGRLGQDGELRYTKNGEPVLTLSIASSKKWKDKQGEWQEKTTWFKAIKFGKAAESIGKIATKGMVCMVTGSMECRQWEGKDGKKNYSWEINADNVVVSQGIRSESSQDNFSQSHQATPEQAGFGSDDIPF